MSLHQENSNFEKLESEQRTKAAVHYTVGKICEEIGDDKNVVYSKQFIAVLCEATLKTSQAMASDLELFAKHGKRSVINTEDVKLLVRKSPGLHAYIKDYAENQTAEKDARRRTKKAKTSTHGVD